MSTNLYANTAKTIQSTTNTDGFAQLLTNGAGTWAQASGGANTAYYIPLSLTSDFLVYQVQWTVGGTANGNFDIGAYSLPSLKRVFSLGSTAVGAGTNTILTFTLTTPALLTKGNYFMAWSQDGSQTQERYSCGSTVMILMPRIMKQTSGAFPLPDPAVPIAVTGDFWPVFSFIGR